MASPRNIKAGRAMVEIFADDSAMVRGLRRAQKRLETWGANIQAVGRRAIGLGASITAPLLATTRVFSKMGDDLANASDRTGVGVESLSELGYAAQETGSRAETLNAALFRMRRRVANAASGTGPAVRALDELGLSAEALSKLSVEDQFKAITDAIAAMPDEGRAAQMAFEIFGDQAQALFPLLRRGSEGIAELREEARSMGRVVSTRAAVSAALYAKRMSLLSGQVRMAAFEIGATLAPAVGDVVTRMRSGVQAVQEWIVANRGIIVSALAIGAGLIAAGAAIFIIGAAVKAGAVLIGLLAAAFVKLGAVLALGASLFMFILSPMGLFVAALATVTAAILRTTGIWSTAVEWIKDRFSSLAQHVRTVAGAIADALIAGDVGLAAEVLWRALEVAWVAGTNKLREIWQNWLSSTLNAFRGVFGQIQRWWDDTFGIGAEISVARRAFNDRVRELADAHDGSTAAEFAEVLRDDPEARRLFHAVRELERQRDELERARTGALEGLDEANADRLQEAEARLKEAQQRLDDAVRRASERREQFETDGPSAPVGQSFDDLFERINGMVADVADRVDIRGALGGQAIEQIVGGLISVDTQNRAADRTADATEETARRAEAIAWASRAIEINTRRFGLAFGGGV